MFRNLTIRTKLIAAGTITAVTPVLIAVVIVRADRAGEHTAEPIVNTHGRTARLMRVDGLDRVVPVRSDTAERTPTPAPTPDRTAEIALSILLALTLPAGIIVWLAMARHLYARVRVLLDRQRRNILAEVRRPPPLILPVTRATYRKPEPTPPATPAVPTKPMPRIHTRKSVKP